MVKRGKRYKLAMRAIQRMRLRRFEKYVFIPWMPHSCGYFGNPYLRRVYIIPTFDLDGTQLWIVGVNDCDDGYITFETPDQELALSMYNFVTDGVTVEDLEKLGFSW